jgi:hypothetical protein
MTKKTWLYCVLTLEDNKRQLGACQLGSSLLENVLNLLQHLIKLITTYF